MNEPINDHVGGDSSRTISTLSVLALALVFGLAGLLLVTMFAAWFWADVQTLALGATVVAIVIAGAIGLYSSNPGHAVLAFTVSGAFLAPVGAWHLPEARAAILRVAGPVIPANTLRLALKDESAAIGTEACIALLSRGYDEVKHTAASFARSPESTLACLQGEVQGTDAENLLRRDVVRLWQEVLLVGKGEDPCRYLGPYAQLAPGVYDDHAARLLNLAVSASTQEVRSCARDEFDASYASPGKQLRALSDPRKVKVQEQLFSGLVRGTYSTDVQPGSEAANSPVLQQWTLSLGCSVLSNTDDPAQTVRYLNTAMVAQNCGALTDQERSTATWSQTCMDSVDPKTGYVTTSEVCSAIRHYAKSSAVEFAKTLVQGSVEIMQWRALNESVKQGHDRQNSLARHSRLVPADAMEKSLEGAPVTMAWEMRRGMGAMRRHGGAARKHMTSEKAKTSGLNREMLEMYLRVAEEGTFKLPDGEEIDLKERIAAEGGDVDEIFSKKQIAEAEELLEDERLDEESEMTVEQMLGEPPKSKSRMEKDREKVDGTEDR